MLDERQSEILGIMFGDGSLSKVGGSIQIAVTGHKVDDKDYLLNHVCPLFAKELAVNMKIRNRPNEQTMDIYAYSKDVARVLNTWGMPLGVKNAVKLQPVVPLCENGFLRGLFDTDGSIYRKYGKYRQIQFKSSNKPLMNYTVKALKRMKFNPTEIVQDETNYKLYLCRQGEVKRFFEEVAPTNQKHQIRFQRIS